MHSPASQGRGTMHSPASLGFAGEGMSRELANMKTTEG
jgi:hypothetical protein